MRVIADAGVCVPVLRPHKGGDPRIKWVRPPGQRSRSRTPERMREKFDEIRLRAVFSLGTACVRCGYADARALQIDHIDGGGRRERELWPGLAFYRYVLRCEDRALRYQVLCANCNVIKRRENGECRRGNG